MNDRFDLITAALYARESSDQQDVDDSVAARLRALRDYADKNGYMVVREYVDDAESGRIADSTDTIATFAAKMSEFLTISELTETKSLAHSFVNEIRVKPGKTAIIYWMPTPDHSPPGGADSAEIALNGGVRKSVRHGGPCGNRTHDLRIKSPLLCRLS